MLHTHEVAGSSPAPPTSVARSLAVAVRGTLPRWWGVHDDPEVLQTYFGAFIVFGQSVLAHVRKDINTAEVSAPFQTEWDNMTKETPRSGGFPMKWEMRLVGRSLLAIMIMTSLTIPLLFSRAGLGASRLPQATSQSSPVVRLSRVVSRLAFINDTTVVATLGSLASNFEIGLVDLRSGEIRVLSSGACASPSPDKTRIAWIAGPSSRGDVWILDLRTGQRRRVTEGLGANCVAWSPDERRLAATSTSKTTRFGDDLIVLAADTGRVEQTIQPDAGEEGFKYPIWYPNGRLVGFVVWKYQGISPVGVGIDAFDLRDRRRFRIFEAPGYGSEWASDLAISPDGRVLLFVLPFRLPVPEGDRSFAPHIFAHENGVVRLVVRGRSPVWLPEGRSILFTREYDCTDWWCAGNEVFTLTP